MAAIVLFGATGFTGRLLARAMVRAGARPVLAGRSPQALAELAAELGGLDVAVADATRPAGVIEDLLEPGDVLVSTVGPFARLGDPAVAAAVAAGAHYLDSCGEPAFVRRVFEYHGPGAAGRCVLVPACGFEHVPGNLAGALALGEAGDGAVRVDTATFVTQRSVSGGTLASVARAAVDPSFAFHDGMLVADRVAARTRTFDVDGAHRTAIAYGGSEHLALPREEPLLREVGAWMGLLGPSAFLRALPALSALTAVPGVGAAVGAAARPLARIGALEREPAGRSRVVGIASDADGDELARVDLAGPDAYGFTAGILAWAAQRAAAGGAQGGGACGPVGAFGLEALQGACGALGLVRVQS